MRSLIVQLLTHPLETLDEMIGGRASWQPPRGRERSQGPTRWL